MNSPEKSVSVQLYKLRYSPTHFRLQLLFYLTINISLIFMVSGWLFYLLITLFSLLIIHSVIGLYPKTSFKYKTSIEIHQNPAQLIWYDQNQEFRINPEKIKVYHTRWFILLKCPLLLPSIYRLLLIDNFENRERYTHFRRWTFDQVNNNEGSP